MNDTYTFISGCGRFQFTVKRKFYEMYKRNTEIWEEDVYNLMTKYNFSSYLHNPIGPAIVVLETQQCSYFIDGKQLAKEDGEKLQFNSDFNEHLMKELGI